jgi:hypothetical protein
MIRVLITLVVRDGFGEASFTQNCANLAFVRGRDEHRAIRHGESRGHGRDLSALRWLRLASMPRMARFIRASFPVF